MFCLPHRPSGGVLFLGQEYVYFHRSRLLVDGAPVCYTDDLDEMIAVGDPVIVHVVDNVAQGRTPILDRCPTSRVALWAQKGAADLAFRRVPSKIAANAAAAFAEAIKIKVVEFAEDPTDGSVSAGVGVVCHPSSNIAVTVRLQKLIGSFVYFEAKDINYFGVSLAGVDLAQVMRLQDELYVNLVEVPEGERAALGFGGKCSHRASKGGTMAKIEANNTALGSWPCFLPASSTTHQSLSRRGLHYTQLEKAAHRRQRGRWRVMREAGLAAAAVTDFVEPGQGLPLSRIRVTVLCGPLRGRVLEADRAVCEVFGHSMAAADLSAFVNPYETVYVSISATGEVCNKLYLGRPLVQTADVRAMSQRERLDLLTYLQSHVLSMSEFKEALQVVGPPWLTFLPFPRNIMQARAIDLGVDVRPGVGNMSVVAIVDQGYISDGSTTGAIHCLKQEPVFVPSSALWVYGHSIAKVDLSYLFCKNQKFYLETVPITDSDRQKLGASLPEGIKYRAQLAWMGSSRPKCDRTKDSNLNDVSIRDWLQKRRLTLDQFKEIVSSQGTKQNPAINRDARGFALTEDFTPVSPAMRSDALESIDYTSPLSNDVIADKKNTIPSLLGAMSTAQKQNPRSLGDLMAQEQPDPYEQQGFGRRGPMMGMGPMGRMGGHMGGMAGAMGGMGGSMMQPYPMERFAPGPHWRHLPVLRHGPEVAHMVEVAATASGPRDPSLMHLIEDDAMAQQAHHISQALQFALDFYKEKVGLSFGSRKTKSASNGSSAVRPAKIQALGDLFPEPATSTQSSSQSQQQSFFGDSASTWDKLFKSKE